MHIKVADHFLARLLGLMFTASLPPDQALLIKRCTSVHTCFMRYPIDLVFVNEKMVITQVVENLKPWRFSVAKGAAAHVIELAAGTVKRLALTPGKSCEQWLH